MVDSVQAGEVEGQQFGKWTVEESPYVVKGDVEVPADQTLIIEPGVTLLFTGKYRIVVYGSLIAEGTSGNRIVFTSVHDSQFARNNRSGQRKPTKFDWSGIRFFAQGEQSKLIIRYAVIRYCFNPVYVSNGDPVLENILIEHCNANVLMINNKTFKITQGKEQSFWLYPKPEPRETLVSREAVPVPDRSAPDETRNTADGATLESDLDAFSFGEISVISATRTLQNIMQAPSAISAIQEEKLQQYGHLGLAELFRFLPGVDVFATNTGNLNINPRGYNRLYSNRTLVLVDNRIVYTTFFGTVFWNTFPIGLQDIQSIEIIRGPSGSLYGANAVSGVVNIVTKRPGLTNGLSVRSYLGSKENTFVSEINYNFHKGDWGAILSLVGTNLGNPAHTRDFDLQSRRGRLYIEKEFGLDRRFSVDVGRGRAFQNELLPWGFFAMPVFSEHKLDYAKVNLQMGPFKLQSYYNDIWFNSVGRGVPFLVQIRNSLFHNSLEFASQLGQHQTLVAGLVYRQDAFKGNVTADQRKTITQYSFYLQDVIDFSQELSLTLGGRIDSKPLTTTEIPLRAAMLYSPQPNHSFRLSVSRGFRSPSLVEYFVVSQFGSAKVVGNTNLLPEQATSYEFGYRGIWMQERMYIGLEIYHQKLSDFILFAPQDSTTISFSNGGESSNTGGELEVGLRLSNKWQINFTYAYQKINDNARFLGFQEASPATKLMFGLYRNPSRGLFVNLWAYYTSKTVWNIARPGEMPAPVVVPDYATVNLYVGYAFNPKARIGISITDLFNNSQNQFPFADTMGRVITAGLETGF
ncbi:MAG: TonB-dependent receptor [candidate division KSB1 bacterium]|nr:TonB-dependent receptor [candidate division KSB1 bacterium]